MPFNKGDFTQQGVAGHVNANLRLNEKRLVNIDMTSNEEAEGCTIAGTVTDLLNDKVYPIGSAPSGNIEITENGENINVAPYATATVNVSGGDNALCNITLIDTESETLSTDLLLLNEDLTVANVPDLSYPATVYGLYKYISRQNKYYVYDLAEFETTTATFSNDLFTNLVNCEIESEASGTYTYWGIHVLDNSKPSSLTINTMAFHIESN